MFLVVKLGWNILSGRNEKKNWFNNKINSFHTRDIEVIYNGFNDGSTTTIIENVNYSIKKIHNHVS